MSTPATPFHKRQLWIVIAAFLALVLVGGGIAAATGAFSGGGTSVAAPTVEATPAGTGDVAADAGSACGLTAYQPSGTLESAPSATWRLVGTTAVPTSPEAGPGKTSEDGTFSTCFAHTPTGALFAAINYYASATDGRNTSRLYQLFAAGPAKDELAKQSATATPDPDATRAQVAGFKINQYSAASATVDLATRVPDGATGGSELISLPTVLNWEDGDWKIVYTMSGPPLPAASLSSLGGYVLFSGV